MANINKMKKDYFLFFLLVFISVSNCLQAQIITTIAGNGTTGYNGDGKIATSAELAYPAGIAIDGSGEIYIADMNNNCIRKMDIKGIISTFAGNGTAGYSGDGGPAISGELKTPYSVAVDGSGNVFILAHGNNCIRKVNTSGIISTIAGNGNQGYKGDGGYATAGELNYPNGIAIDGSGNLYITDAGNYVIRKVSTSGIISTIAGNGVYGYSGDSGPATLAKLANPFGIAVDGSGNVYFADQANNRIRKINKAGIISTIAGNGNSGYIGDGGPATAGELGMLSCLTIDRDGNIYISDNQCIRMVNTSGIINTVAGNNTGGYSGDGGSATSGVLFYPNGIAIDNKNNIYIADQVNNRIRKIGLTPSPPITGPDKVCVNDKITLSNTSKGGVWSCSNTSVAAIGPATGIVNGVSTGTATITFTLPTGFISTTSITVNPVIAPAVIINYGSPADSICDGTEVNFQANPVNTGTASAYVWKVNGIQADTGNTYTFKPKAGDVVSVTLTSNAVCTFPNTVTDKVIMKIIPRSMPTISIIANPGDTVCSGTMVTYTATTTYSGDSPILTWIKNGVIAGTGYNYSCIPSDGDVICNTMVSNYRCPERNRVLSNNLTMSVNSEITPSVAIIASPHNIAGTESSDTLIAIVTGSSGTPAYQWYVNTAAISGATNASFICKGLANHDSVSCKVSGNNRCGLPAYGSKLIRGGDADIKQIIAPVNNIEVMLNPNDRKFIVKGSMGTAEDGAIVLEITNMQGQVVYNKKVIAADGNINEQITPGSTISNGMYLLNISSGVTNKIFHFVVE